MTERPGSWESLTAEGAAILDKLRDLIHEGNVRRVVVEQDGRTIAEFPLTAGVVGALLAPVLAALGALLALVQNCTIHVERAPAAGESAKSQPRSDTPAQVG